MPTHHPLHSLNYIKREVKRKRRTLHVSMKSKVSEFVNLWMVQRVFKSCDVWKHFWCQGKQNRKQYAGLELKHTYDSSVFVK